MEITILTEGKSSNSWSKNLGQFRWLNPKRFNAYID